jgi:hypothetical protein
MRTRIAATALTLALASSVACAQPQGGYFDFTQVPGLGEHPQVQIDLGPQMLAFLKLAAPDPDVADAFTGLQNVRVLVYGELEDPAAVFAFVEDSSGKLEGAGWQRIVYVEGEGSKARIYAKLEGERMVGMTVMVVGDDESDDPADQPGEAVFINIAGDIDPAKLGRIANEMGVDGVFQGVEAPEVAGE